MAEQKKAKELNAKVARALLNKITPALTNYESLLNSSGSKLIAAPLVNPVRDVALKFSGIAEKCRSVLNEGLIIELPELKDITSMTSEAKKHMAVCTAMLANISKAQS